MVHRKYLVRWIGLVVLHVRRRGRAVRGDEGGASVSGRELAWVMRARCLRDRCRVHLEVLLPFCSTKVHVSIMKVCGMGWTYVGRIARRSQYDLLNGVSTI